jgi:DNA-binding transcriptional LysR family regulator
MEFRHLEVFRTVAAMLSFRRAAEALHVTQSTVSAQIRALEEGLGVVLFDRLGRSIALTTAGESLLVHSRNLLDMRDEVRDRLSGRREQRCVLRVRMPQSLGMACLPTVLRDFHQEFPQVGLDIGNCAYAELTAELRSGLTDVAFLLADSVPFAELEQRLLGTVHLILAARGQETAGRVDPVKWNDLAGCRLFVPKHDCSYRMILESELQRRSLDCPVVELNSLSTLIDCVADGQGLALLPEFCLRMAPGRLRGIDLESERFEAGILLITHRRKWMSPELEGFIAACEKHLTSLHVDCC